MATTVEIPRETKEFFPIAVSDGADPVTAFETSVCPLSQRPTTWTAATLVGGAYGALIGPLDRGTWKVYVRATGAAPEEPVVLAGYLKVD